MKLLLITGTFDKSEGKPSHFGNVIREAAEDRKFDVMHYNGGHLTDFNSIMNDIHKFGIDYSFVSHFNVLKRAAATLSSFR